MTYKVGAAERRAFAAAFAALTLAGRAAAVPVPAFNSVGPETAVDRGQFAGVEKISSLGTTRCQPAGQALSAISSWPLVGPDLAFKGAGTVQLREQCLAHDVTLSAFADGGAAQAPLIDSATRAIETPSLLPQVFSLTGWTGSLPEGASYWLVASVPFFDHPFGDVSQEPGWNAAPTGAGLALSTNGADWIVNPSAALATRVTLDSVAPLRAAAGAGCGASGRWRARKAALGDLSGGCTGRPGAPRAEVRRCALQMRRRPYCVKQH